MDRFYTSPELFISLKEMNIGACVFFFSVKIFLVINNPLVYIQLMNEFYNIDF